MANFADWKLSSSESEDDCVTKGVLLKVKNSNKKLEPPCLDISDTYVPLSERLKARDFDVGENSGDDLPKITFTNPTVVGKENVTSGNGYGSDSSKSSDIPSSDSKLKSTAHRRSLRLVERENECVITGVKPATDVAPEISERLKPERQKANAESRSQAEKRKALNSQLKALKPEECMKHMECRISNHLAAMLIGADILKDMQDGFDAHCVLEETAIPSVRWKRKVKVSTETEVPKFNTEPEMLVILPANEFIKMAATHCQINPDETGLLAWMKKLQADNPASLIHLVCHGFEKYEKNRNKQSKKRKNTDARLPQMTPEDIEEVLVDLQIECGTTVSYTENTEEVINMIKQLTKSVGEAPYKRLKRQDIQFINEIPSVKINQKTSEGLKKAWEQMLQQFHNVTPVMASAITDKYPSLLSLVRAYEGCGSETERAERLLADIPVRRGVGTLQTNRRIGPELSCKIHKLLVSMKPDDRLY